MTIMRPLQDVGILGYGAYVPRYRLPASEVDRVWHGGEEGGPIREKAVAGPDEDTVTMAIEAARNALSRAAIMPTRLRAVWVGSESHPYAVKPSSAIVAEAIGATPETLGADWQFACKAGTEALQAAIALVGAGMGDCAMAIGMDAAQGRPGDELEYTAASGGAAVIVGPARESLAVLEGSYSFVTDTSDFWRRPEQHYPVHAGRFTGEPAYFRHGEAAARALLEGLGLTADDITWAVFHQPNPRFPARLAGDLGIAPSKTTAGLLSDEVGNCYAGSAMLGLTAILDVARPGERILQVSFGSGAGSDAFCWRTTAALEERRRRSVTTRDYIARRCEIDYATYARYRNIVRLG